MSLKKRFPYLNPRTQKLKTQAKNLSFNLERKKKTLYIKKDKIQKGEEQIKKTVRKGVEGQ